MECRARKGIDYKMTPADKRWHDECPYEGIHNTSKDEADGNQEYLTDKTICYKMTIHLSYSDFKYHC